MTAATAPRSAQRPVAPRPAWKPQAAPILAVHMASELSRQQEQRELVCSAIGLAVKVGLSVVAAVSLIKLAGAYQERMDRQGELRAVLDLQTAKLERIRNSFDHLFTTGGEQKLLGEQDQWIAPNRLRVVWHGGSEAQHQQPATEPATGPASAPEAVASVRP
ncbi:MAG: hypothetical protein R6W06_01930 [Prochlorococcaceae cyanobacterium]